LWDFVLAALLRSGKDRPAIRSSELAAITSSYAKATKDTILRYANYPTNNGPCYFSGTAGAGNYINFYNANDWALAADHWQLDQDLKPDRAFFYNGINFFAGTDMLSLPQDTYQIFAYCDEARCYALGAQANVSGFSILGS